MLNNKTSIAISQKKKHQLLWSLVTGPRSYSRAFFQTFIVSQWFLRIFKGGVGSTNAPTFQVEKDPSNKVGVRTLLQNIVQFSNILRFCPHPKRNAKIFCRENEVDWVLDVGHVLVSASFKRSLMSLQAKKLQTTCSNQNALTIMQCFCLM